MRNRFPAVLCLWFVAVGGADAAGLQASTDGEGRTFVTNVTGDGGLTASAQVAAPSERQKRRQDIRPIVEAAAMRYKLSRRLLEAVIEVESSFDRYALSSKGAQGLMQLMPDTARDLGVRDVWDPADNVDGGARYLRQMLDRFDQNLTLALAAYNAGPGAVERAGGVPRIPETQNYVVKIRSALGGATGRAVRAVIEDGGTLRLTNTGHTQSSLRLMRGERGTLILTNR